jgi:hypothetical protein
MKAYLQGEVDDDHQDLGSYCYSHPNWGDHFEEFPKFGIMLPSADRFLDRYEEQGEKRHTREETRKT